MTTEPTTPTSKRAFDFARGNLWMCDPHDDLCIVGGADHLDGDEAGPCDTDDDVSNPLHDPRLAIDLDDEFVNNVDAFGIITPITIAKVGDLACVIAGRRRVRAARIVNRRRQKSGQKPITVPCAMRRANDIGLMGAMIAENEARLDDTPMAKMEKLIAYIGRGVDVADAAVVFGIKVDTAKGWLAFHDNASAELKKLLANDEITFYAALRIARLKDPAKQHQAIEDARHDDDDDDGDAEPSTKKPKKIGYRKASNSAKKTRRGHDSDGVGVREMKRMLDVVAAMPHPNASKETLAWWEGVESTLRFVLGEPDGEKAVDDRLTKALAAARAAAKKDAK